MAEIILAALAFPTIWLVFILSATWVEDRIRRDGWKNSTASMAQFFGWAIWTAIPSVGLAAFLYSQI